VLQKIPESEERHQEIGDVCISREADLPCERRGSARVTPEAVRV
jgi:hypothetical protein